LPLFYQGEHLITFFFFVHLVFAANVRRYLLVDKMLMGEGIQTFGKMINSIHLADIPVDGLFLNADAGFDTTDFRSYCYANEIFDNIDKNK